MGDQARPESSMAANISVELGPPAPDAHSSVILPKDQNVDNLRDNPQPPDEVILYQIHHRSSKFDIYADDKKDETVPMEHVTRSEVSMELVRIHSQSTIPISEIHQTFHSARTDKQQLSSHDLLSDSAFRFSHGLTTHEADDLIKKHGRNELREYTKPKWKLFVEQFTAPMPIGIWCAIVIEAILENWVDCIILFCLQMINGGVGFLEANKAGNAIAALKASLKPVAQVKRDGQWVTIDAALLVPGDCVILAAGSAVPADCMINNGAISVDQSAITGESLPIRVDKGMQAQMGSTVARGETEATVVATGMNTFYGKTAALLQSQSDELGELQKLLLRVVWVLLGLSIVLCGITLAFLLTEGEAWKISIGFVVVLMVASIPLAMEVVVTATLALGSRELAQHKAIVAHLSAIERLAGMNILCSDKTGTLTLNKMVIQNECPVFSPTTTRENVLLCAALAAKWKEPPKDALDTMILTAVDLSECDKYSQMEYIPFDAAIKRTESTIVNTSTGEKFRVTKGAPHTLLGLCHNREKISQAVEMAVMSLASRGVRSLAVAKTNPDGQFEMLGMLTFLDPPRPDSKATIKKANDFGVNVKMITGDHQLIAVETAKALELGSANIAHCEKGLLPIINMEGGKAKVPATLGRDHAVMILSKDGFSQALPEHKYVIVEALKQAGYICGMTGDGINDAPALKIASVGFAVQGATDAARAAAHIVLTSPGLNAIVEAIIIARRIFVRMHSFLVYRVAATFQLLVFFFIAVIALPPQSYNTAFPKFWSMPVIALIVITVLNDGTIVSIAYDRVEAPKKPQTWNMKLLWALAITLGTIACSSSLLLLHLALESSKTGSFYNAIGLSPLTYNGVVTSLYLKISLSDFLTIFSARTGIKPCFSSRPSIVLFGAALCALTMSTILSLTWPFQDEGGERITALHVLFVWIYCFIWFMIQDGLKVIIFTMIKSFKLLDGIQPEISPSLNEVTVKPNPEEERVRKN